ncbi:MAG: hypothetical protein Q8O40_11510 [Chloroflexota bacterium]|nr:hypothetical protein [Chloroflexota bacterium]
MTKPRWATAVRKARLVQLWHQYGNRCLQGHRTCPDPTHYVLRTPKPGLARVPDRMQRAERTDGTLILDSSGNPIYYQTYRLVPAPTTKLSLERLYDVKSEGAVRHWVSDDAAQRMAEWKVERERIHRDQRRFHQGQFDSLRRQIYLENQPPYTIVALTADSLTFRPVALVKVSSTIIRLFVELPNPMVGLSKSARRKARRYGKGLPEETFQKAEKAIAAAVQDWWAKRK